MGPLVPLRVCCAPAVCAGAGTAVGPVATAAGAVATGAATAGTTKGAAACGAWRVDYGW